jgi:predicted aldo/keto reductase-like oxidoreductase
MLYREMGKTGDKLSILGYGCMRFPKKDRKIDESRTERQIISAIEQGVNYFDTAYVYKGSETVLGKILAKGYRNKVKLATKLPLFMVHSRKGMEAILDTQLQRLQTDHIDYYLMHCLNSKEGWQRLKAIGVEEFLFKAKQAGKINHIGFSYHGDSGQFKAVVDDYPWEFCQIQYNYMDENTQAGLEGLKYAGAKGLGVVIMEPLRGGLLAGKMPPQIQAVWDQAEIKRTPAEWALRWIWNHPEVTVVLSGMNEEAHIEENIRIAGDSYAQSLSASELDSIAMVKELLTGMLRVGCTACGYCLPCPAGVNIPLCFAYYNTKHLFGSRSPQVQYIGMLGGMDGGTPAYSSLCRQCGQCEKHCPQHLPIRRHLKEVAKDMERFYFKPAVSLVQRYYKLRQGLAPGKNKKEL